MPIIKFMVNRKKNMQVNPVHRRFIFSLVLLVALTMVGTGCVHRQPSPEELFQNFLRQTVHQLKLDASQAEKLELLGEALQAGRETLESDIVPVLKSLFSDTRAALSDGSFIRQLQKIGELVSSDIAPQIIKRLTEFYISLSGEQKARLADWLKSE